MYFFEPNEPIGHGLVRIWAEKLDESRQLIQVFREEPELSIHSLRKNIKRIRALLRLARPAMGEAIYRRENLFYRDLGRWFSEMRDAAVLFECAELVCLSDDATPPISPVVLDRLWTLKANAYADPGHFAQVLVSADQQLAEIDLRSVGLSQTATGHKCRAGFVKTAESAAAGYRKACQPTATVHQYHEWRKQVKYLWHQLEVLAPTALHSVDEKIGDLQHLAGLLGQAHDAAALQNWLVVAGDDLPSDEAQEFAIRLRRYRLDQEGAALAHGGVIFRGSSSALAEQFSILSDYPVPND